MWNNETMQLQDMIGYILRGIDAVPGCEWARVCCGREYKVWRADGAFCYFTFDDLRAAVRVWHWVRV